jgi:hypothetical protein
MNAQARGDCPASDPGGHYYKKQDGAWVCVLETPPGTPPAEAEGDQ